MPKQPKPESSTIRVPRETFSSLVRAVRLAHRDSRSDDRVLHDVTRDALTEAHDALTDYLAERSGVG